MPYARHWADFVDTWADVSDTPPRLLCAGSLVSGDWLGLAFFCYIYLCCYTSHGLDCFFLFVLLHALLVDPSDSVCSFLFDILMVILTPLTHLYTHTHLTCTYSIIPYPYLIILPYSLSYLWRPFACFGQGQG